MRFVFLVILISCISAHSDDPDQAILREPASKDTVKMLSPSGKAKSADIPIMFDEKKDALQQKHEKEMLKTFYQNEKKKKRLTRRYPHN
jgi:hypothetical protein